MTNFTFGITCTSSTSSGLKGASIIYIYLININTFANKRITFTTKVSKNMKDIICCFVIFKGVNVLVIYLTNGIFLFASMSIVQMTKFPFVAIPVTVITSHWLAVFAFVCFVVFFSTMCTKTFNFFRLLMLSQDLNTFVYIS